jgi:hypothetical protein
MATWRSATDTRLFRMPKQMKGVRSVNPRRGQRHAEACLHGMGADFEPIATVAGGG